VAPAKVPITAPAAIAVAVRSTRGTKIPESAKGMLSTLSEERARMARKTPESEAPL